MYHFIKKLLKHSTLKKNHTRMSNKGAPLPASLYQLPQVEQRLSTLGSTKNIASKQLLAPIAPPLFLTLLYPQYTFHVLDSTHRKLLLEHWLSLSAQDLYLRFFQPATPFFLQHRADQLNFDKSRIFGAFDSHGNLVACCEWAMEDVASLHAECAFSTLPSHRTQGLGRHLALWCALDSYHNQCTHLSLYFLQDNYGAKALSKYLMGNKLTMYEPGVYKAQLDLMPFVKKHPAFQAHYVSEKLQQHNTDLITCHVS